MSNRFHVSVKFWVLRCAKVTNPQINILKPFSAYGDGDCKKKESSYLPLMALSGYGRFDFCWNLLSKLSSLKSYYNKIMSLTHRRISRGQGAHFEAWQSFRYSHCQGYNGNVYNDTTHFKAFQPMSFTFVQHNIRYIRQLLFIIFILFWGGGLHRSWVQIPFRPEFFSGSNFTTA